MRRTAANGRGAWLGRNARRSRMAPTPPQPHGEAERDDREDQQDPLDGGGRFPRTRTCRPVPSGTKGAAEGDCS